MQVGARITRQCATALSLLGERASAQGAALRNLELPAQSALASVSVISPLVRRALLRTVHRGLLAAKNVSYVVICR